MLWLVCCATFLSARSYHALIMPWQDGSATFGHINVDQRRGLETLRAVTPDDAVVASMLNGGAIELYAQRSVVRPASWTEEELGVWVDALATQGRPFYVLDDGEEMAPVLARLRSTYRLCRVQSLNLPYFAHGGGAIARAAELHRVEANR
jgi:hypothetical protein